MVRTTAISNHLGTMPGKDKIVVLPHSPWSAETDPGLMLLIVAGSKAAFTELARRHMPAMLSFARRYVHGAEAEDIVQEALTRIWLKAGQWQNRGVSPRSWLMRIVYNLSMDSLRKQLKCVDQDMDELTTTNHEPDRDYQQTIENQQLTHALRALPERQRSAIMLTVYHAMSNREAADVLEISIDALESLLSRGRRGLRQNIEQQRSSAPCQQ